MRWFPLFFLLPVIACAPAEKMMDVPAIYSRSFKGAGAAFELAIYTRAFHETGHPSGVLRKGYEAAEIKRLFPEGIAQYDSDHSVVVWSFEFIPKTMRVHDDHLHLIGQEGKPDTLYYFFAPAEFLSSVSEIIPGKESD